jgi:hypothetical protein
MVFNVRGLRAAMKNVSLYGSNACHLGDAQQTSMWHDVIAVVSAMCGHWEGPLKN